MVQTHHSHIRRDSLDWQEELQAFFLARHFHQHIIFLAQLCQDTHPWAWKDMQSFGSRAVATQGWTADEETCHHRAVFLFSSQKAWSLWLPPDKPDWHLFFCSSLARKNPFTHTKNYYSAQEKGSAWKDTVFSFKECFPSQHFCHDTANRPDIHCSERKKKEVGKGRGKKLKRQQWLLGLSLLLLLAARTDLNFIPSHPPLFFLCC